MSNEVVTLDVREDIEQGREPFGRIMQTVAQLTNGQKLKLIAPFEPVPLFHLLTRQGFQHEAHPITNGGWEVLFSRRAEAATSPEASVDSPARIDATEIVEIDARDLEPPQPMVVILEALEELPAGAVLKAHTSRRPIHLFARVEERGFTIQTEEQADGSFINIIRRA